MLIIDSVKLYAFYNFLLLLFCQAVLSKVLTLKNHSSCSCLLTGEDVYSGAYLNPPDKGIKRSLENLEINFNNDWELENVGVFNFAPVTDQRWENFSNEDYISIKKSTSFSFSIYTNRSHEFQIRSEDLQDSKTFDLPVSESRNHRWFHYTGKKENDGLKIYSENDSLVQNVRTDFTPFVITVDRIKIKLHKYDVIYSENTSPNEKAPTYNLDLKKSRCHTMFLSIDSDCSLRVILKSDSDTFTYPLLGFNKRSFLRKWKRIEISPDFFGNANLSFVREHNTKEKCFWAISQMYNCTKMDLFQIDNCQEGSDYLCKVLKEENNEPEEERWENPGVLDTDNGINCSLVLDEQHPFCENYQICSEEKCYCPWGFNGSSCTEPCPEEYWDVDCRSKCTEGCQECDHQIGCTKCKEGLLLSSSCHDHQSEVQTSSTVIIIVVVVILLGIILSVIKKYKHKLQCIGDTTGSCTLPDEAINLEP